MGGCQNQGPVLGPYYNTAPNIYGTQKGTLILTTTYILALWNCDPKDPPKNTSFHDSTVDGQNPA